MCRFAGFLGLSFALFFAVGCGGGSGVEAPPTSKVKGVVTLDGNPLAEGEITFEIVGKSLSTLEIKDGAFSGDAPQGKNTVAIRAYKAGPPLDTEPSGPPTKNNFIPARFNDETTLSAEVSASGSEDLKFAVTSR